MNDLMTFTAAADYLGVSRATLQRWRRLAGVPTGTRVGPRLYFSRDELEMAARIVRTRPGRRLDASLTSPPLSEATVQQAVAGLDAVIVHLTDARDRLVQAWDRVHPSPAERDGTAEALRSGPEIPYEFVSTDLLNAYLGPDGHSVHRRDRGGLLCTPADLCQYLGIYPTTAPVTCASCLRLYPESKTALHGGEGAQPPRNAGKFWIFLRSDGCAIASMSGYLGTSPAEAMVEMYDGAAEAEAAANVGVQAVLVDRQTWDTYAPCLQATKECRHAAAAEAVAE